MAEPPASPPLGFYRGRESPSRELNQRDRPVQKIMLSPTTYVPSEALVRATNVALLLGMPLLLTGAPGVGKTRLAGHLAEMQEAPFEKFVVTSTAIARDLLYSFDELARMRDAYRESSRRAASGPGSARATFGAPAPGIPHLGERAPIANPATPYFPPDENGDATFDMRRYLRFNALGKAILRACGPGAFLEEIATSARTSDNSTDARWSAVWLRLGERRPLGSPPPQVADLFDSAADHTELTRDNRRADNPTIVLIDEIDKAPREFPNDLLEEIDRFQFAIPELGLRVVPPAEAPNPVLIITSNRETALPDPFLRRCCYHHIGFPDEDELARIVEGHMRNHDDDLRARAAEGVAYTSLPETVPSGFRDQVRRLAMAFREPGRILRPPGLTEIIQWQMLVERRLLVTPPSRGLSDPELRGLLLNTLGVLLKAPEDFDEAPAIMDEFFAASKS